MKALIVIEIPEDHLAVTLNDLYERLKGYKCELNPMPSYKAVDLNDTRDVVMFCHGWNTCLEEITDESNISD